MRVPDLAEMIQDEETRLSMEKSHRFIHGLEDQRVDDSIDFVYNTAGNPKFAGNLLMDLQVDGKSVFRVDGDGKDKRDEGQGS